MTDPGAFSAAVERLPCNVADLNRIVQGLLVHSEWLASYANDLSAFGPVSRTTLPVQRRLAAVLERDGRALDAVRPPTRRSVGTCRDFALMMCAFLRAKGTASRLRCGFASYFGEGWADHWVCEYWNGSEDRWCLTDAQIDPVIKLACGIAFDTSDVPREAFLTAGQAWLRCRAGHDNPERFGNGDARGLWYMKVNVIHDALVMNNQETSPWDGWRETPPELRTVPPARLAMLDTLAQSPDDLPPHRIEDMTCKY
jgi:hypothetical protein